MTTLIGLTPGCVRFSKEGFGWFLVLSASETGVTLKHSGTGGVQPCVINWVLGATFLVSIPEEWV